jgi:hypothetical protein
MMTRTQISLDPETLRRARGKADRLGISLAEYVRRLLDRDLGDVPAAADPSVVFDLGRSGGSDIARDEDRMIGEAIAAEHGPETRR